MSSTLINEPPAIGPTPEELKLGRRHSRKAGIFDPELLKPAFRQSLVMLRPDIQWKNPVMFTVEVGTVLTIIYTIAKLFGFQSAAPIGYLLALDFWLVATLLFANFASAIAEARGKAQADALRKTRRATPARRLRADGTTEQAASTDLRAGDRVEVVAGRRDPRRRRNRRRRGFHRRIGDHRRVGPRDPRGRRGPLGRHRGHAGAFGPDRRGDHRQPRRFVPGPHDRPGGRGHPPADAQRNRPVGRAGRVHADLPHRDRHALADGLQRRVVHEGYLGTSGRVIEPRHRRADAGGPAWSASFPRPSAPCWRPSASPAWTAPCGPTSWPRAAKRWKWRATSIRCSWTRRERSPSATAGRRSSCPSRASRRRKSDAWRPRPLPPTKRPRARASWNCSISSAARRGAAAGQNARNADGDAPVPAGSRFVPFTAQTRMSGIDLPDGQQIRKGRRTQSSAMSSSRRGPRPASAESTVADVASQRGHAAAGQRGQPHRRDGGPGRHPQARHRRALRAAAADGPADGDGHGRQPLDGRGDRRAGGRGRLHRRGHARSQAGLHPQGAGRRASWWP